VREIETYWYMLAPGNYGWREDLRLRERYGHALIIRERMIRARKEGHV
jgi:hypothetical protein